ncbi:T9SS type A sorting domain-containing protein [uncultured Psychroserpens sp.]|uniref:T9SS type A sorting domain-containing protein n=1 Tax=uncultured Psychroserpens sp. TaxID=255436 RepID=UPI00262D9832|nr:T9SS type A sorting domain-containing protein [uncultured Psychroserpens sp.]
MKKIVLLLLLVTGFAKAQIVNIPDANFKATLIAQGVDTNTDGDIQVSEALAQTIINVENSNISDLTGIEAFTNLLELNCRSNQLSSIDVSQNTSLQILNCFDNQLTNLDITQNTNLTLLTFQDNFLTTIDLSQNANLQNISAHNNQLSSLDLSQNVSLEQLTCYNNQLTQLDLSNSPNLTYLDCNMNNLTTLDVSQNFDIQTLICGVNSIAQLDLTQKDQLTILRCQDNSLTSLDTSDCESLQDLNCGIVNLLTVLDLSQNTNLQNLDCSGNGLLTELNIKNGSIEAILMFSSTQLDFICADEDQVNSVQLQAEPTTVVSSYCSFTPGGDYNTITGSVIYDLNEDGCDALDIPQPHIKMNINDGTSLGSVFSSDEGVYNFYTLTGNYDFEPNLENPSWFNITPLTANVSFTDNNNNVEVQDFCITPVGTHNDVEIYIAPIDFAVPAFDALYQIVYRNKGNQTLSGDFEMTFNDDVLDFVSATTAPDNQTFGSLSWDYIDLLPFENRSIYITLNVNSPMEVPAVNIGDQLNFNVLINPIPSDEVPSDNIFEYKQIVVGSYDPNDITCLQGDILPTSEIGAYLAYIVNFENIGNFAAQNVVIEIDIDPTQFDINTLRVLNASDPVDTRVKDDKVKFIFEDINLSASGGHGNILLRIRTNSDVQPSELVSKKADIHFDYNFPIVTNNANTVFQNLSIDDHEIDPSITIYPNPVSDVLTISAKTTIKFIEIYDVQGRIIQTSIVNKANVSLQIASLTNGVYFFKIKTENGTGVEKIIKD